MQNFKAPPPKISIKALVRDKHGRPKISDPSKIKDFLHMLSDEDIGYLKEQFNGEDIYTDYFR